MSTAFLKRLQIYKRIKNRQQLCYHEVTLLMSAQTKNYKNNQLPFGSFESFTVPLDSFWVVSGIFFVIQNFLYIKLLFLLVCMYHKIRMYLLLIPPI